MSEQRKYQVLSGATSPIKAWIDGVSLEEGAREQLQNVANLPFIHKWLAVMPDVHWGMGATIGSVIPTKGAVIPAAVGVDLGCGMCAVQTTLRAEDLPDSLKAMRTGIEKAVPHGRSARRNRRDVGAWGNIPERVERRWAEDLAPEWLEIIERHPKIRKGNLHNHLGTLGTGNHFVEVCLDEAGSVWFMLHSGSRGVGNRIGRYFINLAKEEMQRFFIHLPDANLAYLAEGTDHFDDYCQAVSWAQRFASINRELMMEAVIEAVASTPGIRPFDAQLKAVNCHHNYIAQEEHYGESVWVTRKGAVRAGAGEMGIIPGSMGARSYIVRGKGNPESFCSCSHGAGRVMSRTQARRQFTVEDQIRMTQGVECRKDEGVIDEIPAAYKDIEAVIAAQSDLIEVEHTLRQIVCVKG